MDELFEGSVAKMFYHLYCPTSMQFSYDPEAMYDEEGDEDEDEVRFDSQAATFWLNNAIGDDDGLYRTGCDSLIEFEKNFREELDAETQTRIDLVPVIIESRQREENTQKERKRSEKEYHIKKEQAEKRRKELALEKRREKYTEKQREKTEDMLIRRQQREEKERNMSDSQRARLEAVREELGIKRKLPDRVAVDKLSVQSDNISVKSRSTFASVNEEMLEEARRKRKEREVSKRREKYDEKQREKEQDIITRRQMREEKQSNMSESYQNMLEQVRDELHRGVPMRKRKEQEKLENEKREAKETKLRAVAEGARKMVAKAGKTNRKLTFDQQRARCGK